MFQTINEARIIMSVRCKFCALVLADSKVVKKGLSLEEGRKCCSTEGNHSFEQVQTNEGIFLIVLKGARSIFRKDPPLYYVSTVLLLVSRWHS
jgi:hypothetical protein